MFRIKAKSRLYGRVIHASLCRIECGYHLRIKIERGLRRHAEYCDVIVQDVSSAVDFLCDDFACDFIIINKLSNTKIILP